MHTTFFPIQVVAQNMTPFMPHEVPTNEQPTPDPLPTSSPHLLTCSLADRQLVLAQLRLQAGSQPTVHKGQTRRAYSAMSSKRCTFCQEILFVYLSPICQMLRPEIQRRIPWWTYVGAASGGALGYIIANIPGMVCYVRISPF